MKINEKQDTTIYQDCSFYLACRLNNEPWTCYFKRPFLLHITHDCIYGQFISSMWFTKQISEEDTLEMVVLRLPYRNKCLRPTQDVMFQRFMDVSHRQENFEELEFVVLYTRFTSESIRSITSTQGDNHQFITKLTNQTTFGLSFNVIRDKPSTTTSISTSTLRDTKTNINVSCPSFSLKIT